MQEQISQSTKLALANTSLNISRFIEDNNKGIKALEQKYAIMDAKLKEARQKIKTGTQKFQALSTETEKLAANIKALKDSTEQLAKMNNRIPM
jgi:chromosome segregation ATPase